MKTSLKSYDVSKSAERIDKILNSSSSNYEESKIIPDRDKLTYENGYYVNVGAIFIDIRQSSTLTDEHKRPKLAKLYRSYISEVVSILNSYEDCKEINIVGDCVSGIFEGQYKEQIQNMANASAQINSLIKILNYKLIEKGIVEVSVGIGLDYGRALMIQAGYSGSGINDVIWMGDVVNSASNLCNKANKDDNKVILVSCDVYIKLTEEDKKLLSYNKVEKVYECDWINCAMDNWYEENCK
ncbi:adenylate/guanylate cyclase domain-containing protein [Paraclostridium sordellii]|uniref:adenylate/guanylate cyclase domain-containing protein n=1 Tax=Paraclostridium sordellii TaxID=1505 RepID=UPI0005DFDA90|nr:adenylate/guanylate cyclase domain-containing protein [Paeniclostridium sordellii]CEN94265.1 Adenylate and Guanylate cyclase catalytic domain [[Clostridium] sordellii] [Paeniclostridium sordellii]CEN94711.1 Adenylate and Guanylate cyclase catalytic domain [[Clostridium] sordellii] [Paeniclostridium sordellii]